MSTKTEELLRSVAGAFASAERSLEKAASQLEMLDPQRTDKDYIEAAGGDRPFCCRCFDTFYSASVRDIGTTCPACGKGVLLLPAGMIQQVLAVGGKK